MAEIGFDEFNPRRSVEVCRLMQSTQGDRRIAPQPTTSDPAQYPRRMHMRSLAERHLGDDADAYPPPKPKPHPNNDDPWNTNYRDARTGMVTTDWKPEDGTEIRRDEMWWQTDEQMGGPTRLMNTPAARHPIMQLHGNIPRVRADAPIGSVPGEKPVRVLEHANLDPCVARAMQEKEDREALEFYKGVLPHYAKIGFHSQKTPLIAEFLSAKNVARMHRAVEEQLAAEVGMGVRVDSYDLMLAGLMESAQNNTGLALSELNMQRLTQSFIIREVERYRPSMRHQERFKRWYLEGNRPKYQPHGQLDHVRRGEVTIDTSGRELSHPDARFRDAYLKATGLGMKKKGAAEKCPWT